MKKSILKQAIILSICLISLIAVTTAVSAEELQKPAQSTEWVEGMEFTAEQMNAIVQHVDDATVEQVTEKLGSATPTEYVKAFLEADPSLVSVLQEIR